MCIRDRAPIKDAKETGFDLGEQQIDAEELTGAHIRQVEGEDREQSTRSFADELAGQLSTFDPYASIKPKKHNTVEGRVSSSSSKPTKRATVNPERAAQPMPSIPEGTTRESIAEEKATAKAAKQGTQDVT